MERDDRLSYYESRFIGIDPRFLEALAEDFSKVSQRYTKLMDFLQYNNPPYTQRDIQEALNIPQPSISRTLSKIKSAKIRVRADIDLRKIALKTIMVRYEGVLLPVIPMIDWVSTAIWASGGTIFIYRIPPEYEKKLVDIIAEKLGEPSEVVGFQDQILAKPSIEYYFYDRDKLDPIIATKLAEEHSQGNEEFIRFTPPQYELKYRDPRTLELISYLEYDMFEAKSTFLMRHGQTMYRQQLEKASRIMRGAKVMFLDKREEINAGILMKIESSEKCNRDIARILAVYPYAVSVSLTDEGDLIVALSMPYKYFRYVSEWILGMCGKKTVKFKAHVYTLNGVLFRQFLPWMNYNSEKHYWDFDETPKLTLARLLRIPGALREATSIYYMSVKEYVEKLASSMGEDYVKRLIRDLPPYLINYLSNLLSGQVIQGGGESSGSGSKAGTKT